MPLHQCGSAAAAITCACATHAYIAYAILVYTPRQDGLQPTGEQVALQGRGARHGGGRESILNVRAAVARIYMHAYEHACASRSYVSRSESKGLYLQRHVLKASRHGGIIYIGLSKVEIHLMHFL